MGLGSTQPQYEMYYLSLRAQDKEENTYSHFKVQKKEGNAIVDLKDEREVSGYLVNISHGTYVYKEIEQKCLHIFLVDGKQKFKIEININSTMGRNVANTLLTLDETCEKMFWRAYNKKGKDANAGKEFAAVWIGKSPHKEDALNWKYSVQDADPYIDTVEDEDRPGKFKKKFRRLNDKLWAEYQILEAKINPVLRQKEEARAKAEAKEQEKNKAATAPAGQSIQQEFDNQPAPFVTMTTSMNPEPEPQGGEAATDDLPF